MDPVVETSRAVYELGVLIVCAGLVISAAFFMLFYQIRRSNRHDDKQEERLDGFIERMMNGGGKDGETSLKDIGQRLDRGDERFDAIDRKLSLLPCRRTDECPESSRGDADRMSALQG